MDHVYNLILKQKDKLKIYDLLVILRAYNNI